MEARISVGSVLDQCWISVATTNLDIAKLERTSLVHAMAISPWLHSQGPLPYSPARPSAGLGGSTVERAAACLMTYCHATVIFMHWWIGLLAPRGDGLYPAAELREKPWR